MNLWIAREKWGGLYIFGVRPFYDEDYDKWQSPISGLSFQVNDEEFPEVTFENSPQRVELELPDLHIIY